EQAKVAVVSARFVRKKIGPRLRVAGADTAAMATVNRQTDKVGLGEHCLREVSLRGGLLSLCVRYHRLFELRRVRSENLCDIAVWAGAGIFEHDVRQRDGAEIAARTRVWHPGCRSGFGRSTVA